MISRNGKTIARTIGADHDPVRGELLWGWAPCRDDPDAWFPVGKNENDSSAWEEPRRICATCPFRAKCLQDAIDADEDPWGMHGGKTPDEIMAIRNAVVDGAA